MEAICAEYVVKTFGKIRALDGIKLRIAGGELFFLLGASGCGKTTLLRCIAGLETPDSGTIRFGENDVTDMPPHKRGTAMVFQSYALWPHLTVAQNISFGLEERRVPKLEIKRRVAEVLEMVQLPGFGNRSINQMSGGQQQRVSLARALVVKPRCILLDEPLSNLDTQLRVEMRRQIRDIIKQNGLTGIYVTHDQEEALAMADRMAILNAGKIDQIGTPEEIYRNPRSRHVASFIGETNLIPGKVCGISERSAQVWTSLGILTGCITDKNWTPTMDTSVCLSIRPEAWKMHMETGENPISGKITERGYLGQRIQYWIDTAAGRQQVVEMNPRILHSPGEELLTLHASHDDVVVLREDENCNA